jgi:hypothetical protein
MIESLAQKMQRRGFPLGILITRDGPYGATSSRNLYADELTPEELADHESKGLGYPHPVEIPRLSNPQPAFQDSPASANDSPPSESSNQPQASASPQAPEQEANSPTGQSAGRNRFSKALNS